MADSLANLFSGLFVHTSRLRLFVSTCRSGRSRMWPLHQPTATSVNTSRGCCRLAKLRCALAARPAARLHPSQQQAAPLRLLTCSSICMRTARSLSSCCRSSSISLRSSSTFSSSRASGEPMPSSFSSARLRLGEAPLNSWAAKDEQEESHSETHKCAYFHFWTRLVAQQHFTAGEINHLSVNTCSDM